MLFNSLDFLVFFGVLFTLYYTLPDGRGQVVLLILGSLFFYGFTQPWLVPLLVFSALLTGLLSYAVGRGRHPQTIALFGVAGIAANLLVLAFFKYNRLLEDTLAGQWLEQGHFAAWVLTLPLPVGISFYTFQGISLVVDSLRRDGEQGMRFQPEPGRPGRHLAHSLFYIAFFPQLIAGPIVKANQFFPQIGRKRFSRIPWDKALPTLVTGYFLKVVVADNLQVYTATMRFPDFTVMHALNLWANLFGFSMQIFADFAGYSLIAIGLAALLGYQLPRNFDFPYIARSVSDFWRRWHISLSSWLRDYLYIPLGGNRHGSIRTGFNLMAVMALGGLWHGAGWNYALWGIWHGSALVLERPFLRRHTAQLMDRAPLPAWRGALAMFAVFLFVTLSWLLFQLPDSEDALLYMKGAFTQWSYPLLPVSIALTGLYALPVIAYHGLHLWSSHRRISLPSGLRQSLLAVMTLAILFNPGPQNAFVYFQF